MNKLKYALIFLIVVVSSFTHLYRIDQTFIFHNDEARDVLIVKKMIDTGSPVLLGPQTSVGNMYLGPFYYYLMLPALLLTKMDPVGPAIMVALFGVLTTLLLFWFGSKKHGLLAGTITALFYALSPVMLHYSRSSWNPNLIPFFTMLLLFSYDLKTRWGWFILGLAAGVIFQLHYVALVVVVLVLLGKLRQKPRRIDLFIMIFGFFLTSSPFWLFEVRHQFVNSQAFLTFLREGSQTAHSNSNYLARLYSNFVLIIKGIVGSGSIALTAVPTPFLLLNAMLLYVVLPLFAGGRLYWYILIGSTVLTSLVKTPFNVHYISYLFPIVSLSLGSLTSIGPKLTRTLTLVMLAFLVWHSLPTLKYNLAEISSVQTKRARATADYIVDVAGNRSYNVVSTPGTYATPIEYYLALSNHPPVNTHAEIIFDICEGAPCPLSDQTSVVIYGTGPTHPAIEKYLGHPAVNEFSPTRTIIQNELAAYDIWVATMTVNH